MSWCVLLQFYHFLIDLPLDEMKIYHQDMLIICRCQDPIYQVIDLDKEGLLHDCHPASRSWWRDQETPEKEQQVKDLVSKSDNLMKGHYGEPQPVGAVPQNLEPVLQPLIGVSNQIKQRLQNGEKVMEEALSMLSDEQFRNVNPIFDQTFKVRTETNFSQHMRSSMTSMCLTIARY